MADKLRRDPKHKDFINVICGFGYTGKKLEPYTRNRLQNLHQQIYGTSAGLPRCQNKCSLSCKLNFKRWCNTCSKWRGELLKSRTLGKVEWEKTESWNWPDSYENIVEVFLPYNWNGNNRVQLSDISTQCHIWSTCTAFKLNQTFIKNAKTERNLIFHNASLRVSEVEKSTAFDALKDLIKDPDTHAYVDVNKCLNKLNDIENDDRESKFHEEWTKFESSANERQRNIEEKLLEISSQLTESFKLNQVLFLKVGRVTDFVDKLNKNVCSVLTNKTMFIFIAATLAFAIYYNTRLESTERGNRTVDDQGDCFSENYSYPFEQDLPLLDYVRDYKKLVGRKWLFQLFERKLLHVKTSSRGIVSVAEFGYGKSAIISHLLCAKQGEKGRFLRDHVTAFHICKYDVASTQSPERFIRRMVGFFATRIPEYGSIISLLSEASVLYDSEKCAKELEACFDQAIRIPFKKIKTESSTRIIVIDALDECYHSSKNKNFILDLLSTRIQYFPKWIQFLITTRDMVLLQTLRKLKRLHLLTNDSNNLKDIEEYVEMIYKESSGIVYSKSRTVMKHLRESSEGNFLYIIHALQYIESPEFNGTLPELPLSLEDIYELNFDRQFQGGKTFSIAKVILEVICASLTPLNKIGIYDILKNSETMNTTFTEFEQEFEKLTFFVKAEDGVILRHKAIHSWLIASSTGRYKVSLTKGHILISKHLLKTVEKDGTGDILPLVIHLSNSKDQSLRKVFLSFDIKKVMYFEEENVLQNLISMTNSEDALELLLSHHLDVNIIGKNGVSPAFHAAAKGHLSQLKLLLHKGADLHFVVNSCRRCNTYLNDITNAIEEIKTTFYSGYGLLHIAVQHESTDVTKYLLEEISLDLENALGQRPSDIACEIGDIEVVKMLMSNKSDVIDNKCLYLATKNGHFDIVKYILDSGFRPSCIANKTATNELDRIMQSCKCENSPRVISSQVRPLDTWWIVLQETPLHYAIRSGHSKIAKYITEKTKRLNRCTDAYGYTPFLLGIKHDRYQITRMLRDSVSKDKCSSSAAFLTQGNVAGYGTVIYEKGEDICPEGATFAHLIAVYDRTKVLDIFENDKDLKWNIIDKSGNRPIHYAARHGSIGFMRFMSTKFGKIAFEERSSNGSTAFHAAAISCSELSLKVLSNDFHDTVTDFKDNENRSLIHYALMCERGRYLDYPQYRLTFQSQKYLFSLTNISHVDNDSRNILHYILRFGQDEMLHYLQDKFTNQYKRMLNSEDKFGFTPVASTIHFAPDVNAMFSSDIKKELFNGESINTGNERTKRLLYHWEICLINILKSSFQENASSYFIRDFDRIIVKSPFLTKAVLTNSLLANSSNLDASYVKKLIVNGIRMARFSNREHILALSVQAISYVLPKILHDCGKSLFRSPLHYIALTFPWTLDKHRDQLNVFYNISNISKKAMNEMDLHCSTSNGLNLLHYCIKGGYIKLANYLIKRKLPIVNENVSATDVLYMTVFARFNDKVEYNNSIQYSNVDTFLSKFIKERKSEMKESDFCSNKPNKLSLVHMFAVNGMDRALKTVADLYGIGITHCKNIHNFTPMYFAHLFGRESVIEFLEKKSNFIFPDESAAEFLLLNIINNFPQMRRQNPFRCLTSKRMSTLNTRALIQNYQCLKTFYEMQFVTLNKYFIHNLVYAREGLYLVGKFVLNYLDLKRIYKDSFGNQTISVCSKFVKSVIKGKEALTGIKNWSEIRNNDLSWTSLYPFLKNIRISLDLPSDSKLIPFVQAKVQTDCSSQSDRYTWHTVMYLERTLRTVIQNLQDITVLIALMDQKAFVRIQNMPLRLNVLERNILPNLTEFGFSACHECTSCLGPNVVYIVNRFRYLNILKSTITYKHIDRNRIDGQFLLSKNEREQLHKNTQFIYKMMRRAKRRQKWMPVHFKSEMTNHINLIAIVTDER
ncbi:uncharacterized protein LOC123527795 [Mercenaria mercenaria]|uniref:uncharacterized protein LOC123527795 n=1 Tax=Mercenaria mercenaria TaxID=6596 RepID=UPI00234F1423|nr:uncharacterized protein LOC123527795 [Mercenaria mercenaria]